VAGAETGQHNHVGTMDALRRDLRVLDEHEAVRMSPLERACLVDAIGAAPRLCDLVCNVAHAEAVTMSIVPVRVAVMCPVSTSSVTLCRSAIRPYVRVCVSSSLHYSMQAVQTDAHVKSLYIQATRHVLSTITAEEFARRWHVALREARSVRLLATLVCLRANARFLSAELADLIDREFVCHDYT
jgi:hypothetical protein